VVVMVVGAMSVMMMGAVVVLGKRLPTKTNSYTPITTNTTNNTTKHAINYY
jgi:hypothetical protein